MSISYDKDFYGWCMDQSRILRENSWQNLPFDFENLAEEIESLGRGERRQLISALRVLFAHLLKWEYQPDYRSISWELTIIEQRDQVMDLLKDNPSLKPQLQECADRAYEKAKRLAAEETRLPIKTFPVEREFTVEWALNGEIR